MPDFRFGPDRRLKKASEYSHVFSDAFAVHNRDFTLLARDNPDGQARLGLVIAKRKVPTAVARNRIKRHAREVFRQRHASLPPADLVLLAKAGAGRLDRQQLALSLNQLLVKLSARYANLARST